MDGWVLLRGTRVISQIRAVCRSASRDVTCKRTAGYFSVERRLSFHERVLEFLVRVVDNSWKSFPAGITSRSAPGDSRAKSRGAMFMGVRLSILYLNVHHWCQRPPSQLLLLSEKGEQLLEFINRK